MDNNKTKYSDFLTRLQEELMTAATQHAVAWRFGNWSARERLVTVHERLLRDVRKTSSGSTPGAERKPRFRRRSGPNSSGGHTSSTSAKEQLELLKAYTGVFAPPNPSHDVHISIPSDDPCLCLAASLPTSAQLSFWTPASPEIVGQLQRWSVDVRRLRRRRARLEGWLSECPCGCFDARTSEALLALPMPNGKVERFRVVNSPIMAPELAARFPDIQVFAGQGVDTPEATVALT